MAVIEQDVEISEEMREGYERALRYACAAALIREHGWWQGALLGPDGQLCLIGALATLSVNGDIWRDIMIELRLRLGADSVTIWNDAPGRTEEEVLALLDELSCA